MSEYKQVVIADPYEVEFMRRSIRWNTWGLIALAVSVMCQVGLSFLGEASTKELADRVTALEAAQEAAQ